MQHDFTSGSVPGNIARFSLSYLFSYILHTLYGMSYLFIVGRFHGVDHITAVSIGSQVMHMLTVMLVGLAMGSTVMIGMAVGARNQKQASGVIGSTVVVFIGRSGFFSVCVVLF